METSSSTLLDLRECAAPVVEKALGTKMVLPERKMSSVEEFIERYPTVKKVMIDGTERPISRPKDRERLWF